MLQQPARKLLAELIMTKRNGDILIVKVFDNPTYDKFYYWFAKVGLISRVSSRDMPLENIPAYLNKGFRTMPQLQIMDNPKFIYYDKARYLILVNMPANELGITSHPISVPTRSMGWLDAPLVALTPEEQQQVKHFHRQEHRKLGLAR